MTREAKVGLLVGLAFIIVVGILLKDYDRLENEPSPWTTTADTLRSGAATPHNGSTQNEVVLPPVAPPPSHPVLTREETREVTKIAIGPGNSAPNNPVDHPPVRAVDPDPTNTAGFNGTETELQRIARQHGEDVVKPGSDGSTQTQAQTVNGAKQYVAVAGDTLNKLAGRFLGANTKANREAIVALNPTLKQNPNNIIVGRTYAIPAKAPASATAVLPVNPTSPAPVPTPPNMAEAVATTWYTVKENDNLWRIAAAQLGDGTAWIAIRDMNKDVLKGGDAVRVNMRLRLPPKSVATTN